MNTRYEDNGTAGRILLVEDEANLRPLIASVIEGLGYTPVAVATADEGLASFRGKPGDWSLVITDVVTPGQANGCELAWAIQQLQPQLNVLVMSGYMQGERKALPPNSTFLSKPWSLDQFETLVQTLASPPGHLKLP